MMTAVIRCQAYPFSGILLVRFFIQRLQTFFSLMPRLYVLTFLKILFKHFTFLKNVRLQREWQQFYLQGPETP